MKGMREYDALRTILPYFRTIVFSSNKDHYIILASDIEITFKKRMVFLSVFNKTFNYKNLWI